MKKRPAKRKAGRPAAAAAPAAAPVVVTGVNMAALTAAKELLKACGGDVAAAQTAVKQIVQLMN